MHGGYRRANRTPSTSEEIEMQIMSTRPIVHEPKPLQNTVVVNNGDENKVITVSAFLGSQVNSAKNEYACHVNQAVPIEGNGDSSGYESANDRPSGPVRDDSGYLGQTPPESQDSHATLGPQGFKCDVICEVHYLGSEDVVDIAENSDIEVEARGAGQDQSSSPTETETDKSKYEETPLETDNDDDVFRALGALGAPNVTEEGSKSETVERGLCEHKSASVEVPHGFRYDLSPPEPQVAMASRLPTRYFSYNGCRLLPVPDVPIQALSKPISEVEPETIRAGPSRRTRRVLPTLVLTPKILRGPGGVPNGLTSSSAVIRKLVLTFMPHVHIEIYLLIDRDVYHLECKETMQSWLSCVPEGHYARFVRRAVVSTPQYMGRCDLQRFEDPPRHIHKNFSKFRFVAYVPVKLDTGYYYLLEIWNGDDFTKEDKKTLRSVSRLEAQLSAFLLEVAQAVFEEMVSLDQLIKKILEFAQRLVSADRASLFLVDYKNFQLVSTVFDLRYEPNQDSDFSKKEIRMPIDKGIAGHVAMSGETMNIPDAYSDQRFNKAVDEATGYRTVSILCMPIKVRGKVIAVVQMVNKRDKKAFKADDEAAFQVFSTFFGLALHNARLYDKIKRKEQKYKVALEVLGYHNTCTEEDVATILEARKKGEKINYNDFELNPFEVDEVEKCKGILMMFDDLFDIAKFDVTVLTRFVLTVKKNYRKVPYHNFDHGWSVANSMYVILKHDTDNRFDHKNRLALYVAALCHDLDHRGYTNKFMSDIESPLAAMYTTSTLEHHHFNMTVTILQQDGHNIFYQMAGEEYKDMLDSIRLCILATDLAAFFPNLKRINELVFETPQFDWGEVTHRNLVRTFCMTCADLCAAAKPFKIQLCTVNIISTEFYLQGDMERAAGRTPIPMMDRQRPEELPACQVGFLSQVCLPSYTVLCQLFPNIKPMLDMVNDNLESWKARAADEEKKKGE